MNYTTKGEILQDTKNGKERPWREKKIKSSLLAESFLRLDLLGRALRTNSCSAYLKFNECDNDDYKKLIHSNFCRDRMCPMCNWRRSRKLQNQIFQILHAAYERQKMRFIFLTLTVKNVKGDDLDGAITEMLKGFKALFDLNEVDDVTLGYVRTLEVTYNIIRDDYHPHIHVLMAVKPSYFDGANYIKQTRWAELWQGLLKLDYEPVVDIRLVKQRTGQVPVEAALEMGKYTAKDKDYIHKGNEALTDKVVLTLATALKSRRLIGFGKLFRKLHKELNLKDVEGDNADLIGGTDQNCICPICSSNLREQLYKWHIGFNAYVSE